MHDKLIDMFQPVAGSDALQCTMDLAAKEGIFCGISGGATFAGALKVAETAPKGAHILVMIPDTGERYLSTPMFEGVAETMTDAELEIAASTPRFRFDVSGAAAPAAAAAEEAPKPHAVAFVDEVLKDADQPVVLFALEWCEFCWSVRKMFAEAGIAYRSVDLDAVAYQEGNKGGDIRTVLRQITGVPTIPQIFVAGQHIDGATETFDAFNDGSLKAMLTENAIAFDPSMTRDAYSFLPKWLHPR
jgi:cysteine synthase A